MNGNFNNNANQVPQHITQQQQMLQQSSQTRNAYQDQYSQLQSLQQQQQQQHAHQTSQQQRQVFLMAGNNMFTIGPYKKRKDACRVSVLEKYEIIGYIAAGTYGKVYKAKGKKDALQNQESANKVNLLEISSKNHNADDFASIRNTATNQKKHNQQIEK